LPVVVEVVKEHQVELVEQVDLEVVEQEQVMGVKEETDRLTPEVVEVVVEVVLLETPMVDQEKLF
jgi:uncharacterized membrane protein